MSEADRDAKQGERGEAVARGGRAAEAEGRELEERAELVRRVIDLEMRAAFQAETIEALDGVVREFAARVQVLERQVMELASRPGEREQGGPQDEPPSWV